MSTTFNDRGVADKRQVGKAKLERLVTIEFENRPIGRDGHSIRTKYMDQVIAITREFSVRSPAPHIERVHHDSDEALLAVMVFRLVTRQKAPRREVSNLRIWLRADINPFKSVALEKPCDARGISEAGAQLN